MCVYYGSEKKDLGIPAKILQEYSLLSLTSHKHGESDFISREREDLNVFRTADGKSLTKRKILHKTLF